MVKLKVLLCHKPTVSGSVIELSERRTTRLLAVPAADGVPVIVQLEFTAKPVGKVPETNEQKYGSVPPVPAID